MLEGTGKTLDSGFGDQLGLDRAAINALRSAGTWGRFMSIVSFVFFGLAIIGFLMGGASMFALIASGLGGFSAIMILIYGLFFALGLYVTFKLYQFSTSAIRAADTNNSSLVTEAMESLAIIFRIYGVITAIVVGLYVLAFLFAIVGGLAGSL